MSRTGPVASIVLAAGKSERMGYPKPLLIFGKETAVDRIIRVSREAGCDPVVVVLGHEAGRVRATAVLAGATVVVNDAYEEGQTVSLQTGLRALGPGSAGFIIFPVDHALVDASTVAGLVEAWRTQEKVVVVPVSGGRRGHPVVCSASLAGEILSLAPGEPARRVTVGDPGRLSVVETEDGEVVRDMDTPADYNHALEVYSARGGEAGFLAPRGAAGRAAPKARPGSERLSDKK